jgi:hypothetical protein
VAITLRALNPHWLVGTPDPTQDLCVHSTIEFRVDDELLVGREHGEFTVSAAALFLLRTLSKAHEADADSWEQLFPCCGFNFIDRGENEDVLVLGCPNGVDMNVSRHGDEISVATRDGRERRVTYDEWRGAVCSFADSVRAFYDASARKRPSKDDAPGFKRFVAEWERRRKDAG